jgi:hypothetical protein
MTDASATPDTPAKRRCGRPKGSTGSIGWRRRLFGEEGSFPPGPKTAAMLARLSSTEGIKRPKKRRGRALKNSTKEKANV